MQSVELKFNCFFLMPIIDTFPTRLREELESAYEEDLDEVGAGGEAAAVWLLGQLALHGSARGAPCAHRDSSCSKGTCRGSWWCSLLMASCTALHCFWPSHACWPELRSCASRLWLAQVFDVAAVRAALEQRLKSLELELHQASRAAGQAVQLAEMMALVGVCSACPGGLLNTCTFCPTPPPAPLTVQPNLTCHPTHQPSAPPQVERLQRKFAMIHSTLAQQQSNHKGDGVDTPKLRHRWGAAGGCCDLGTHHSCCFGMLCPRSVMGKPLWQPGAACAALLLTPARHHVPLCSEENPLNGLSRSGALPPGAAAAAKVGRAGRVAVVVRLAAVQLHFVALVVMGTTALVSPLVPSSFPATAHPSIPPLPTPPRTWARRAPSWPAWTWARRASRWPPCGEAGRLVHTSTRPAPGHAHQQLGPVASAPPPH